MVSIYFFTENLLSDFVRQGKAEKGGDRVGGRDMDRSRHQAQEEDRKNGKRRSQKKRWGRGDRRTQTEK